jgi:hypothetical protein
MLSECATNRSLLSQFASHSVCLVSAHVTVTCHMLEVSPGRRMFQPWTSEWSDCWHYSLYVAVPWDLNRFISQMHINKRKWMWYKITLPQPSTECIESWNLVLSFGRRISHTWFGLQAHTTSKGRNMSCCRKRSFELRSSFKRLRPSKFGPSEVH